MPGGFHVTTDAYRTFVAANDLQPYILSALAAANLADPAALVEALGAAQVAVMELSVGAGLVTVLLVYAVSVVGDDAWDPPSVVPKPLAFAIVAFLLIGLALLSSLLNRKQSKP